MASNVIWDSLTHGSPVVLGVLYTLLGMSVWSWAVVFTKWNELKAVRKLNNEFMLIFNESSDMTRLEDSARRLSGSPLAFIYLEGLKEFIRSNNHRHIPGHSSANNLRDDGGRWLTKTTSATARALNHSFARLSKGITVLASVSSTAPFIGLLGTVWGIMDSFMGLSEAKSSTIQAVAPGISEALIATAVGLAAAIPAAIAFNYFSTVLKQLKLELHIFQEDFINALSFAKGGD